MANIFDQFDEAPANVFDQFDESPGGSPDDVVARGSILPLVRTRGGDLELGVPEALQPAREAIVDLIEGKRQANEITGEEILSTGAAVSPLGVARGAVLGTAPRSMITGKVKGPTPPSPSAVAPAGSGPAIAAAGERIGVPVPRAATSDVTGVQQVGRIVSDIPVVGSPLREASERTIRGLGDAAVSVQEGFGSGNIKKAGEAVKEGLTTFITDTTRNRVKKRYDKVDALIDDTVITPLQSTARKAQEIILRRQNARLGESKAVGQVADALAAEGGLNYRGIKDLRTSIGEMLDNPSLLPSGTSGAELKQIYGSLSGDLRRAATNAGGPKARKAFDSANAFNNAIAAERKALSKVVGDVSDEAMFDRVIATAGSTSRANLKLLQNIRRAVRPETFDEIASAVIHKLGRDAEGNFSPARFIGPSGYNKLSPAGKKLLFQSTGKKNLARSLDDIAAVSSRLKRLQAFANPSGTGQFATGVATAANLLSLEPIVMLSTALGAGSGRFVSTVLSKPSTARGIATYSKAYERMVTNPRGNFRKAFELNAGRLAALIALEDPSIDRVDLEAKLANPEAMLEQGPIPDNQNTGDEINPEADVTQELDD